MKKSFIYILIGAALMMSGCKDSSFFRSESPSAMDVSVFYAPELTNNVIAGIYTILGEQNAYRSRLGGPWVNPGTDCEVYQSSAPSYAIYTMTTAGHSDIVATGKHPWIYLTAAIERANVCIDGIEQYSDTTKAEFRYFYGEALTLRAWLHYEMIKLWGDIPAMFAPIEVTNEASIYPTKVDRNMVFEQLRKDLKHAAMLMPNSASCPGVMNSTVERCNREAALALLARIDLAYAGKALRPDDIKARGGSYGVQFNIKDEALRAEVLGEAVWACEEVIKADGGLVLGGKLMANYEDVFRAITSGEVNYSKTETLWEIPFANGIRGQLLNRFGAYVNKTAFAHLINTTKGSKSNSKMCATPYFYFSFDPKDARRAVTANIYEWAYDNKKTTSVDPAASGSILYQSVDKINKMYLAKYRMEWLGYDMLKDDDGVNIPIIRYSDVLLMYAEAMIGSNYGVTPSYTGEYSAQAAFDLVRSRAGLSSTPLTFDAIVNERAWEFTGEFIRRNDLMRWGLFEQKLKEAQAFYQNYMTVTDEKIDFSGTPLDGKYAQDVYVKYTKAPQYSRDLGGNAYVISEIYGLKEGENDKPEGYISSSETGGWLKCDFYTSEKKAIVTSGEPRIYGADVESTLEARQYWPLFDVITSANHNLWNDYIYQ